MLPWPHLVKKIKIITINKVKVNRKEIKPKQKCLQFWNTTGNHLCTLWGCAIKTCLQLNYISNYRHTLGWKEIPNYDDDENKHQCTLNKHLSAWSSPTDTKGWLFWLYGRYNKPIQFSKFKASTSDSTHA